MVYVRNRSIFYSSPQSYIIPILAKVSRKEETMARIKAVEITKSLRERIAGPEWQKTRVLPNERALSDHYGVARNTIRRALSTLEQEGILTRHVGRETVINETFVTGVTDLSAIVDRLTEISPFDIMNMRLIIEPHAAATAAQNASEGKLEALRDVHMRTVDERRVVEFEALDAVFHELIFRSARNEFLKELNELLVIARRRKPVIAIRRSGFSEARRLETIAQHEEILKALMARDAEAATEAMKLHLSVRSRNLFGGHGEARHAEAIDAADTVAHADETSDDAEELLDVMERIAGSSPADVMNVRLIVEPKAASVSAANARRSDLVAIRNAHELATSSLETEAFEAWDGEFHKRIFESTRNDFLTALHDIFQAIRLRKNWLDMKRRTLTPERRLVYCDQHGAIYQAIANRDPILAAEEMHQHLLAIQKNLF